MSRLGGSVVAVPRPARAVPRPSVACTSVWASASDLCLGVCASVCASACASACLGLPCPASICPGLPRPGQPAAPPFATVHHCERLLDNFPTCMRNRSGTMLRVHPWEPSWIHRGLLLLRGVVPMGASCWKPSRVCPSRSTRSSNTTRWGNDLGATGKRIHEASKRWDRPSS